MQRKTINNEAEWVAAQKELFAQGYGWAATGRTIIPFCGSAYPVFIKYHNFLMTWSTFDSLDIAETISNEAVYLEALKRVWAQICVTAGEVNVEPSDLRKQLIYNSGYRQIRDIVNAAIYTSGTGTGEVDMTQERAEDRLSIVGDVKLD